ncbi:MAG TPA: ATP-binding protein, partial [Chthonomonadaceae bacterium]|nr:ATP-binding protein [Chthonomonadaceae bacterium]
AIGMADDAEILPGPIHLNNTVAGRAIAERQTQFVTELDDAAIVTPRLKSGQRPAGLISSPIWQGGRDYGVIEVYFTDLREIADNSQSMLAAFAHQTAIALHRADLYEQLEEHQRQLHSIVENAPVSIVFFDVNGVALSVNSAAARRYDADAAQMAGRPYSDFLYDLPDELFARALDGIPFHASHHIRSGAGAAQSVCDLSLVPVRDGNGVVSGVLLLSFDVTDLVNARQDADEARQAAEHALDQLKATQNQMVQMEKIRAIGELASGVAHDFNNALMAILGYTEMAEESLDSPDELAGHLSIIRTAAEDAKTTVRRLQEFAKQRARAHGEPVDVNAIVKDVIDLTRPRWRDGAQKEGRAYTVTMQVQPVPAILAEPSGMREVLVNLVYNALNAMPNGGDLVLSTQPYGDKHVEICVADTGIGMTPEVAARIFDPFFTTRGVEGTGLGLSVSWTIIQRFGGKIELDTAPGKGTRFMLRFPTIDAASSGQDAPRNGTAPERVDGKRALIVDDEPLVASVLTTILTRHGYRVVSAHSANAALGCLEDDEGDRFDVVLSDHGMPGTTGLELLAEIKRRRPDLPVVLLTGWGESILQVQITDVKPDAVLGKPINQADLIDAMAQVLRRAERGR